MTGSTTCSTQGQLRKRPGHISKPCLSHFWQAPKGRLIVEYQAADTLIRVAYGLREYQYQGPPWLHTARYDIEAVTPSPQPRSMQLIMLQTLLTDRFKLKSHHESKTIVVYSLVAAKGGPT